MPSKLFQTASGDILMNAELTNSKQPGSEQDAPPRGSALHIETALTYARMAKRKADALRSSHRGLDPLADDLSVVVEQLEEVSAKIKKQWQSAT